MFWLSALNLTKNIQRITTTIGILCLSFSVFGQSQAHSITPILPLPSTQFVMPPLPEISTDDDSNGPYTFAYPFETNISKHDISSTIQNDTVHYCFSIYSKDAYSLNVIFEHAFVPQGSSISLYSKDFTDSVTYSSTEINQTGILATNILKGDSITIHYKEPKNAEFQGDWTITQVAHDYKNILYSSEYQLKAASTCSVDINCESGQDWQIEKRAVCKLIIRGVTMCTGTLVANTARDNTPYVLTANHCVSSESSAYKTVFYFDYENETCGESTATKAKTISGASLVATADTKGKVDFSLLQMNTIPPKSFNPYYAGWNRSEKMTKGGVCIHHPKGDVKKISISSGKPESVTFKTETKTYAENGHWKVSQWDEGTTEGGSSGSALFDSKHLIIGDLSGGAATCDNPRNDFFSKISYAWNYYTNDNNRLDKWLDPLNLESTQCEGYDPYTLPTNVLTNVWDTDSLYLFDFANKITGLWTSTNEIGWTDVAEQFFTTASVYDVTICGKIDTTQDLSDVELVVWKGTTKPEEVIYSQPLDESMKQDSITIYTTFTAPITPNGNFWVGYQLHNNSTAFSAFQVKTDEKSTTFVRHPKEWTNTKAMGFDSKLAILLHTTNRPDTLSSIHFSQPFFKAMIFDSIVGNATQELFGIDSLGNIKSSTNYEKISSTDVSNWSGPNECTAYCFFNKYIVDSPIELRSIKLAIADNPHEIGQTNLVIWDEDLHDIYLSPIDNYELKKDYFNQIHLDTLIHIDSLFYAGVCLDTTHYTNNISLYMYYDAEARVDGFFTNTTIANKYSDLSIFYNVGIQPIIAKSKYHFNTDSNRVIRYPLSPHILSTKLESTIDCILYPTICTDIVTIKFLTKAFANVTVSIFDDQGKCVLNNNYTTITGKISIPVTTLSTGMYSIKITDKSGTRVKKFIHTLK